MATRVWDGTTEGDVWVVDSEMSTQDSESDYLSSCETDSTVDSTTTIQSTDIHTFFRVEHGRAFSAYEGIPMVLPTDNEEIRRLQIQHHAVKLVAGEALDEIILTHLSANSDGRRKRVLDVRTQTGMWADEIAVRFPEVDVKSIDVAPTIPHLPRANLQHEVYDIQEGILEADGTFDIVHARYTIGMVMNWCSLLKDMHRVLRPGGLFIYGELFPAITLPGEYLPALQGPASRLARLFEDVVSILTKRGIQIGGSHDIDTWLSREGGLWGSQPTSGFHNIVHKTWEMPINGLWHPDPVMQEVGLSMALSLSHLAENSRPILLSSGLTDSEFDEWVDDIRKELRDPMNNAVVRFHLVCAYKL
ncbi:hypothetical protein FRC08_008038 [Ceratobasidium sp. 394]|nr:hypothetical protein FRC08_008038 [Ceratobasidium sp. 394]